MIDKNAAVALDRVEQYDAAELERVIRSQLERLGASHMFDGKKVVVKPNLVMKKSPEAAATTHPVVLEAMLRILKESAADIVIAESPGGLYTEAALRGTYRGCGLAEVAERMGVRLNYDTSFREISAPEGHTSKVFNIIAPILDADVIVNLPKLKSHSLTGYSGAVKNYFGVIPGVQKFEMHARFPDYNDFGSMLADLCGWILSEKPTFNLMDGILAMEGNGPTGGDPRKMNCLLSGCNPFTVDLVGASIIGAEGIIMLEEGKRRGFCPENADGVTLLSEHTPAEFAAADFKRPDTVQNGGGSLLGKLPNMFGGRLNDWLQPRPVIAKNCLGCGECMRSCPRQTIEMVKDKAGKKRAKIKNADCIRCYCCQELCPYGAVKIKKNPIIRLIGG
ncbi:MAG: DUF362 domain-containing protein [Ruminococcaceae bacterium]|nr:DUF362 domain-containing protein [Oscillospiraceae bacterium]